MGDCCVVEFAALTAQRNLAGTCRPPVRLRLRLRREVDPLAGTCGAPGSPCGDRLPHPYVCIKVVWIRCSDLDRDVAQSGEL